MNTNNYTYDVNEIMYLIEKLMMNIHLNNNLYVLYVIHFWPKYDLRPSQLA